MVGTGYALVAFHAHPDDEALLTGGTLARAAAEGHRVVLVTATRGERGLAGPQDGSGEDLARVRMAELNASAQALGCARVVWLGYDDSGLLAEPEDDAAEEHATPGRASTAGRGAFARADVEEAATRLASLLREEGADVLTTYDRNGGYGHPDHVQVHRVGARAAELAGTPIVLEATVPADLFRNGLRLLRLVGHALGSSPPFGLREVFSDRRQITHRVRVGRFADAKRAALAAHASQRRAVGQTRVLEQIVRMPRPLFGIAFGREWFIEPGRALGGRTDDVFDTIRGE